MTSAVEHARPPRDQRVDFYRGIALAMIFINHIPGNVWEDYTSRNFGFSDAAELFVFLAGYASAFAYGREFLGGARLVTSLKAFRRAGLLYLVHIALTMFGVGLFIWSTLAFGRGDMLKHLGLDTLLTQPLETVLGLVTLGHQIGYVNILPMYCILLAMLPALLVLARAGGGVLLGASFALWAASNVFALDMPNFPYPGGWFFNPFAWQLIFSIGLVCGLSKWRSGKTIPYDRRVYGLCLAYLAASFLFIRFELFGWERLPAWPVTIVGFDKTFVSLPRFLHLLAILYVFAHMPKTSPLAKVSADNPFTQLGRHSLPIFAVGTILSLICQVIKFDRPPALLFDTMLVVAGLAIQFALARFLDWWRLAQGRKGRAVVREPQRSGAFEEASRHSAVGA